MLMPLLAMGAVLAQAQWLPDASGVIRQARARRAADASAVAAALKAPSGVSAARGAFDAALSQGLILRFDEPVRHIPGDAWPRGMISRAAVVPEAAGQAWLSGGRLVLASAQEPALGLMHALAAHPEDGAAIRADYARDPAASERLDGGSNGHMIRNWFSVPRNLPVPVIKATLGRIVLSELETACEWYPFDQDVKVPSGVRAAGLWHLHPPRVVNGAWFDGDVPGSGDGGPLPSSADGQIGAAAGGNLTLVFRLEGFDAYEVTGKGAALIASYRSLSWATHFSPALARLTAP